MKHLLAIVIVYIVAVHRAGKGRGENKVLDSRMTHLMECCRTRRSSEAGWVRLKKEREILEKEKEQFRELMEKEKAKLKLSEQNRAEKNKTLFERERSIRKCEDKLTEKNWEEEKRLRRANFDSLVRERKLEKGKLVGNW